MSTLREAAQAALNAWEYNSNECRWHMDNLRAALAAEPQPLTDAQIESAITRAVKSGETPWMGFVKDADGEYTLPSINRQHMGIARAIERAIREPRP
jgi:hypothetical protein